MTLLGIQSGDGEVRNPCLWYPRGNGTFDGENRLNELIQMDRMNRMDRRYPGASTPHVLPNYLSHGYDWLYVKQIAHLEASRVRLGGRPIL